LGDEDKTARVYAAMIRAPLDRGVGKVLQGLADTNEADNTLVIFTSDNGGEQEVNAPYRGWKATFFFEGGIRVPVACSVVYNNHANVTKSEEGDGVGEGEGGGDTQGIVQYYAPSRPGPTPPTTH